MSAEGSAKRYLARVRGKFPGQVGQPVTVSAALRMTRLRGANGRLAQCACTTPPPPQVQNKEHQPTGDRDQDQDVRADLDAVESSSSAENSDRTGALKPASTTFRLLGYDEVSDTSLVQAELHSGRRHQIRGHLAVLRHPIANDDLYCPGGIGWDSCRPVSSLSGPSLVENSGSDEAQADPAACSKCSSRSYPTDEKIAFVDDSSCGNPLRKMFTDARVAWCPSCDWALAQLDATRTLSGSKSSVFHASPAEAAHEDAAERRPSSLTPTCENGGRPVTTAGGRIWLHALEYRFRLEGHRYRFQTALPDFVWGVPVPDYNGVCSKAADDA